MRRGMEHSTSNIQHPTSNGRMAGDCRSPLNVGCWTLDVGCFLRLLALSLCFALSARAADRSFATRFSANDTGDIAIVANTSLTASSIPAQSGNAANVVSIQNGTNGTASNLNDNANYMTNVDVDADGTTFNSSSATLTLPSGASVLFAGLYWGADISAGPAGSPSIVTGAAAPNASLKNQVKFATPGSGYSTITATQTDTPTSNAARYNCFAAVTSQVAAARSGTYTVANVQAGLGSDRYGGWSLVVVYRAPGAQAKSLVVFDGMATVGSGAPANITVSGFTAPASGAVNVKMGVMAYEGDRGTTGDQMAVNGTRITDATNPSSNSFNSSISAAGANVTTKNPSYVNQLGYDSDLFTLPNGVIANGATSATVALTSTGDVYYPAVVTSAIDLYAPQITATKSFTDLNAGNVLPGDILEYTIAISNTAGDAAGACVLRDPIPTGMTYVPGSVQITAGANTGAKTDAQSDDQGEFESGNNRAVVRLGTGANGSAGGTLAIGASATVKFRAQVNAGVADGAQVSNQASISYTSVASGFALSSSTNSVSATIVAQADVVTTVTGPPTVLGGASYNYTVTATNNGPVPATNVVIRDTLPSTVTFVSASNGGTHIAGAVTWPTIASLANGASVSYTLTVTAPSSGTLLNVASSTATSTDPTPANNNGSAAASRVTTTVGSVVSVAGNVYLDANHNIQKDAAESGTGLVLFAKLISVTQPTGPALQAVTVDPVTGAFTIPNVPGGSYTIVLNGDSVLANVTPAIPSGWSGTEYPSQSRPVAVTAIDVPNQNFGLIQALTLSGRVFADTGAGGGTANDGALNGSESGLAGVPVRLTDASGTTTYDTATTDGAGNYALLVPNTLANGTALKVTETNVAPQLSTGASVGNTAGTYDRGSDTVAFTFATGTTYTGVNFGNVPGALFTTDGAQSGLPGSFVVYSHTFTAGSAGSVTFSTTHVASPNLSGWNTTLFRDTNTNSQLDAGDTQITAAIALTAGQTIQILAKVTIPNSAPFNAQDALSITANFSHLNAAPALSTTATRTDLTTVGNPTSAGLALVKSVDRATALPGGTITYTITYTNNSSDALSNVILHDSTPAFTTFTSAANGPLPGGLSGVTLSAPSAGASGAIRWTFTGTLAPGSSGSVTFRVTLAQ